MLNSKDEIVGNLSNEEIAFIIKKSKRQCRQAAEKVGISSETQSF